MTRTATSTTRHARRSSVVRPGSVLLLQPGRRPSCSKNEYDRLRAPG